MRDTTEEEDGVTSFSDVLLLSEDILSSGNVGEDGFSFGLTGKECPQMLCFDGGNQKDDELLFTEPSLLCRDSLVSPLSSGNSPCTVDDKSSRSIVSFIINIYIIYLILVLRVN